MSISQRKLLKPLWAIQKVAVNDADSAGMIKSLGILGILYTILNRRKHEHLSSI